MYVHKCIVPQEWTAITSRQAHTIKCRRAEVNEWLVKRIEYVVSQYW